MKRLPTVSLVALAMFLLMGGTASAAPASSNFGAPLRGAEEVPPVDTDATGNAVFKLVEDGSALQFKLIVANIEDVTQAHIHCGAAGVNGPVVLFLFGFEEDGVTTNGILAEGTGTNEDIIAVGDSLACPGGVADFDDLIAKMRSGDAYVNVHTVTNPGGEIRGQIKERGGR